MGRKEFLRRKKFVRVVEQSILVGMIRLGREDCGDKV